MGSGKSSSASVIHQDRIPTTNSVLWPSYPPSIPDSNPILNPIPDPIAGLAGTDKNSPLLLYSLPYPIRFHPHILTTILAGVLVSVPGSRIESGGMKDGSKNIALLSF